MGNNNEKSKSDKLDEFLEYYDYAQNITGLAGNFIARLLAYDELGNALDDGNLEQDLENCKKELQIAKEKSKAAEARACANLGNAYRDLGNFKEAIRWHNEELDIALKENYAVEAIDAHGNLGTDYQCLGNFEEAKQHHLNERTNAEKEGDKVRLGRANSNVGKDHFGLNEITKGIECHKIHLSIAISEKDKKGESFANSQIGIGYCKLGKFDEAVKKHEIELSVAEEFGGKPNEVANARLNLGNAYRGLHRTKQALYHDCRARFIACDLNKALEGNASYSIGRDYESMGLPEQAVDEYQKSVTLYNMVRDSLKDKDKWKISFRDSHQQVYTALWRTLLRLGKTDEALCAAEQGRAQALVDLLHLRHGIKEPDYPEDTIRSYISGNIAAQAVFLTIESNKLHFWVLRKEKKVEFRQLEVNMATVIQHSVQGSLDSGVSPEATGSKSDYLCNLYKLVIEPIRDLLQDGDDLIIIPDGQLFLAPYYAFQHIVDVNGKEAPKYLFEEFRIRIAPSLTSLKLISNSENLPSKSCALLVGNPSVDLECAEREVQAIKTVIERKTGQGHVKTLTRAQATKTNVLQHINEVELIHIAAHAKVQTGEIDLAGDGVLTMSDVQGVRLQAKLVVLSCCNTGKGKITADGVVGIARAFLAAGAHSVLVSLCEIVDQSTMQFMERFYEEMAIENVRQSASLALQRTMHRFRNSEKFCAVKNWAPFLLIGDDVTLEFGKPEFHTPSFRCEKEKKTLRYFLPRIRFCRSHGMVSPISNTMLKLCDT